MFDSFEKHSNGNQTGSIARGGRRQGAGRKSGTKNKATLLKQAERAEIIAAAEQEGETPLEYMLKVMRTSADLKRKDAMAIAAAPYVHAKLAAIEHKGDPENPIHTHSRVEFAIVDDKG